MGYIDVFKYLLLIFFALSSKQYGQLTSFNPTFRASIADSQYTIITTHARYEATQLRYDEALHIVNQAIAANPNQARYYTLRGELTLLLYEWDNAQQDFATALELDAEYAPTYFHRGVLFYTMAQREEALRDFQAYLDYAPYGRWAEQARLYLQSIQQELEALQPSS
jgi:tetratricopeptide (TPR) repeat protein